MRVGYLNDKVFLQKLNEIKNKHIITKLVLLDTHNRVEEELMGYAKEGSSVSIDSSSTVRRTCSLTLVMEGSTEEKHARIQNLLAINRKMKLQIGIKNNYKNIFPEYANEECFWFNQGTYFINTVSFSNSVEDGLTISLSLSDKMCLLNGENGGIIPADTVLNTMETYIPETAEGSITNAEGKEESASVLTGRMISTQGEQVPLEEIITELVNHFGKEDLTNIILDLPENVRLCQTWGGNSYKLLCEYQEDETQQDKRTGVHIKNLEEPYKYYLNDDLKNQYTDEEKKKFISAHNISNSINEKERKYLILRKKQVKIDNDIYDYYILKDGPLEDPDITPYGSLAELQEDATKTKEQKQESYIVDEKSQYLYKDGVAAKDLILLNAAGDIGFTLTDLVYPSTSNDFVATKGSPITESLDNIKDVLENYEYFYDVEGKFRFQEIKNYLNTSQSTDLLNSIKASTNIQKFIDNIDNNEAVQLERTNEIEERENEETIDNNFIKTNYSFDKYRDTFVYDLTNSPLVIDISNDPQYSLVKNDFVIWGTNGAGLPIRYHVAIDDIPDSEWCYTGYWMYSKMVSLDTSIDSIDPAEGGYVNTLTYLKEMPFAKTKEDFPAEGQLGIFYYIPSDYNEDSIDVDKVYYWNGVDYYIYYCNGSGTYSFWIDDPTEAKELMEKYGPTGTGDWKEVKVTDQSGEYQYYTMQITENNKDKDAAQTALEHRPYSRVIEIVTKDEEEKEATELINQIVDGRGYQVRRVRYNTTNDWRTSMFLEGKINELSGTADNNPYYAELKNEWPKIIDINPPERTDGSRVIGAVDSRNDDDDEPDGITLELKDSLDLTQATYYLDILNPSDRIKKFSIPAIGRRSDVYGETGVNCIFENDLPPYIYIDSQMKDKYKVAHYEYIDEDDEETKIPKDENVLRDFSLDLMKKEIVSRTGTATEQADNELKSNQAAFLQTAYDRICEEIKEATELGYTPVVLYNSQYKKLQGGGTACSAYEQAKNLIYQGTCYNEKVTVTMMPVYYFEPNTRIRLQDTASGVNGDYIIDSIDLPLDGTGTMSLVCSRALDKM